MKRWPVVAQASSTQHSEHSNANRCYGCELCAYIWCTLCSLINVALKTWISGLGHIKKINKKWWNSTQKPWESPVALAPKGMFTSWRILECPVLPLFGVYFITCSRVASTVTASKGAWRELVIDHKSCSYNPGKVSILHEISQHVISNLYHHLLLSAPIETVYVLNSVKNVLHTCSAPLSIVTWHAKHMKSNYSIP